MTPLLDDNIMFPFSSWSLVKPTLKQCEYCLLVNVKLQQIDFLMHFIFSSFMTNSQFLEGRTSQSTLRRIQIERQHMLLSRFLYMVSFNLQKGRFGKSGACCNLGLWEFEEIYVILDLLAFSVTCFYIFYVYFLLQQYFFCLLGLLYYTKDGCYIL